ncbi:MAG: hypothetical protein Q7R52_01030, partial [archaeon]|nr:hypothetical protein [archaeon]
MKIKQGMKKSFGIFIISLIFIVGFLSGVSATISSITVTSPNGGEFWNGAKNIQWTAIGCNPSTDYVNIQYSTGGAFTTFVTRSCSPSSYDWDTIARSMSDGATYQIRIFSDNDFLIQGISNNVFTIDNTKPTSSANNNLGTYKNTATFNIGYTLSDGTGSGVNYVELYYNKNNVGWTKYGTTFTSSPISFNSATTGGDGNYEFYTRATDMAENVENAPGSADATTTIDIVKPTTSDDYEANNGNWQQGDQTITLTPTDATSGILSTKYCTSAIDCTPNIDGNSKTISTIGTSYFRYQSIDNAGNIQDVVTRTVMIDKTDPIVTIDAVTSPTATNTQTITGT